MKKLVHERMDAGNGQAHPVHRPFYKIGLASLALTTAFTFGSAAFTPVRAQDTSTKVVSTQNGKTEKKLPEEVAKLPTVQLADIQKLEKTTKIVESQMYVGRKVANDTSFSVIAHVDYPDGTGIAVTADICISGKCHTDDLPDKYVAVASDGKLLSMIDLAQLGNLYKKVTGNDLQYVKLFAGKGVSPSMGDYVVVYVVPVEKPDGDITGGMPILTVASPAKTKDVYAGENRIAMR